MRSAYRELLIQLRFLLRSGVPIREALLGLADRSRLSRPVGVLLEELERGESLGGAMAAHPRYFPPAHAALIHAAEQGGSLPEMIETILHEAEAVGEIRKVFLVQAVYPISVIIAALVLAPLSLYLFTGRIVNYWPVYLVVVLVLSAVVILVWRGPGVLPDSGGLRERAERLILAIPGVRGILRLSVLGRVLRLEGLLLGAGLSFEESLPLVRKAVAWRLWEGEIEQVAAGIREGRRPAESFRRLSGLPEEIAGRIESAEVSGRIDAALRDAGEELQKRFLHRLNVTFRVLPILLYLIAFLAVLQYAFSVFSGMGRLP